MDRVSVGIKIEALAFYDADEKRFLDTDEARERRGERSLIELVTRSVLQEVSLCAVPSDDEARIFPCGAYALSRAFDRFCKERRMLGRNDDAGADDDDDPQALFERILFDRRMLHVAPAEPLNIVTRAARNMVHRGALEPIVTRAALVDDADDMRLRRDLVFYGD